MIQCCLKKIVFPAPLVQQLFDINFHDTVSFLSANIPNVLFPAGGKCMCPGIDHSSCPRTRSPTVVPRQGSARTLSHVGFGTHWGWRKGYVHEGERRGVSFLKEKPCIVWLVREKRTWSRKLKAAVCLYRGTGRLVPAPKPWVVQGRWRSLHQSTWDVGRGFIHLRTWRRGDLQLRAWQVARDRVGKRLRDQHPCSTPKKHHSPYGDGQPEMWISHLWPWGWARQRGTSSGSRFPEIRGIEPCFDQCVSDGFWESRLRMWRKTCSAATWPLE